VGLLAQGAADRHHGGADAAALHAGQRAARGPLRDPTGPLDRRAVLALAECGAHALSPHPGRRSEWCGYGTPGDAPVDQRREDGGSLCFEIAIPEAGLAFAGDANVQLRLSADRPVAQVAARLVDVHPDGRATRLSFGVLNLTHRDGDDSPEALEPGKVYDVTIPMKHVAQSLPAGHRLRLALSSSYFPMTWPAPEPVMLSVHTEGSALELPLRAPAALDDTLAAFDAPVAGLPPPTEQIAGPETWFRVVEDAATGETRMEIADGGGVTRLLRNDITVLDQGYETFGVMPDDATTAWGRTLWRYGLSRGDWSVRSETSTTLRGDAEGFIVTAELRAWEADSLIVEKRWEARIARDHM